MLEKFGFNKHRNLKNYLINNNYQTRYVVFNLGICLLLTGAYFSIFFLFIKENYYAFIELGFLDVAIKEVLYNELHRIYFLMAGLSLLFMIIIGLVSLFFSHRVAGPIYKITKVVREMREKNTIHQISLRKNDEFQELCDEINRLIMHLQDEKNKLYEKNEN